MTSIKAVQPAELQEQLEANKGIWDEYFNIDFVRCINDQILEKIINPTFFRPVFVGFDELIERNNPDHPVILASNHSGMAFPWDAIVFGCGMYKKHHYDVSKLFRPLAAPMLSQTALMNPYMVQDTWRMSGGIDATFLNFETMMFVPESNLLIYPEGVPGIGKGFNHKYELQRFATSFIRLSLKYKTDIVPFATVNAEYVHPFSLSFPWLNRLVQKIGIPFLPISPITLFILLQPWVFYLSFPAKMTYVRGRRIKPYELVDKPYEDLTEDDIESIRDKVKESMQQDLNEAVKQYGKKPYNWGEFFKAAWQNKQHFPYYLPFMWAFLFVEFERQWFKQTVRDGKEVKVELTWFTWLKYLIKNPIIICYFIPIVGWIPLGYRGYTQRKESRKNG